MKDAFHCNIDNNGSKKQHHALTAAVPSTPTAPLEIDKPPPPPHRHHLLLLPLLLPLQQPPRRGKRSCGFWVCICVCQCLPNCKSTTTMQPHDCLPACLPTHPPTHPQSHSNTYLSTLLPLAQASALPNTTHALICDKQHVGNTNYVATVMSTSINKRILTQIITPVGTHHMFHFSTTSSLTPTPLLSSIHQKDNNASSPPLSSPPLAPPHLTPPRIPLPTLTTSPSNNQQSTPKQSMDKAPLTTPRLHSLQINRPLTAAFFPLTKKHTHTHTHNPIVMSLVTCLAHPHHTASTSPSTLCKHSPRHQTLHQYYK
ncbi:hypothetical protein EGR_10030 [Echinococcus granulosus]|uniref:Uncharacterized protein n=1 Tax=Echinococcus granulosus TaxID=6210 RepID=W6U3H8_ECHGR|nr:hypothetical protein EGR_10030 [Echinococcus granulosus]EUB55121.1 hypothetical protein EGR_10030 [Echinococcus granulosus]